MTFLESRTSHVAPLLFESLNDWQYVTEGGEPEIMRSQQYFAHLATSVAFEVIEIILAPPTVRKKGILVIGYLNSFLDEFDAFLERHLAKLCTRLWNLLPETVRRARESRLQQLDYGALRESNLLAFSAMEKAGGRDCSVCFFCCPRRQRDDRSWAGDALHKNLLYVALTRASWRLWVVLEDLRPIGPKKTTDQFKPPRLLCSLMDHCAELLQSHRAGNKESIFISNDSTHIPMVWRDRRMWSSTVLDVGKGNDGRMLAEALTAIEKVYRDAWFSYDRWNKTRGTKKANRRNEIRLCKVFDPADTGYFEAQLKSKYCQRKAPEPEPFIDVVEKYAYRSRQLLEVDGDPRCL